MDLLRSKCSKISCYTARKITPCLFYIVRFNLLLSEALKPPNVSQRGQKLLGLRPRSLLTSFRHIWRLLSPRQTQISPDNVKGKAEYCYQCNKISFLHNEFESKLCFYFECITLSNMGQGRFALEWLSHDHLKLAFPWLRGSRAP